MSVSPPLAAPARLTARVPRSRPHATARLPDCLRPKGCALEGARTLRMRQRVTVITLGVDDLSRARAFYEALGWRSNTPAELGVAFFQAGEMVVSLWDRQ